RSLPLKLERGLEQRSCLSNREAAFCSDGNGNHPPLGIEVIELVAVTPPPRGYTSVGRDLPLPARRIRKWLNNHLIRASFIRHIGEPPTVGGAKAAADP